MEAISSEERFDKITSSRQKLKNNFAVVFEDDLDWLFQWAEFGITVYKMKKEGGNDRLGSWRPSTDNRGEQKQEQSNGASCDSASQGSSGDVLAADGLRSGVGMEGNMAEEKVRGE